MSLTRNPWKTISCIFVALIISFLANISPASAQTRTTVSETPIEAVTQAKASDPEGLAIKVSALKMSPALMALFAGAPSGTSDMYLEYFAAVSTPEQVREFVTATRGKHFVVDENIYDSNDLDSALQAVKLVDGEPISHDNTQLSPQSCCRCWRARVAAAAYFVGSGLICTPAGVIAVVGGIVCNGIFFAIGMLPNFDDAY